MAEKHLGGEWRKTGAKDRARWEGRRRFLRAVEQLCAACLQDLERSPMEAFAYAHAETLPPPYERPPSGALGDPVTIQDVPPWVRWPFESLEWDDQEPIVLEVHGEIQSWGKRWELTDPWLMDVALLSLRFWHHDNLKGRFADPSFIDTGQEHLVLRGWFPMWESWAEYMAKMRRELAKYRGEKEAWAESEGMKLGIKKRGSFDKHFEWLARYQVLGESYGTIGKAVGVHPTTVGNAVRKIAGLIDLTLRDVNPGGRKPSS